MPLSVFIPPSLIPTLNQIPIVLLPIANVVSALLARDRFTFQAVKVADTPLGNVAVFAGFAGIIVP
jgi:hypothetical protein